MRTQLRTYYQYLNRVFALLFICISILGCKTKEDQLWAKVKKGDAEAMHDLAFAYESPTGGGGLVRGPNTRTAIELYRRAANLGYTPSMYALSQVLTRSITDEERVMWLKKGAELGNGACVTELIKGYNHGLYGLPRDPLEAFHWARRGWEMDFEDRHYDQKMRTSELNRLLSVYRAHLKISLTQKGIPKQEVDQILEQIK